MEAKIRKFMFSSLIALAIGHSLPLCAFAKTHASSSNRSDANVHESEVSAPHPNASIHDAWEKQRELAIHYSQSIETAPKAEAMFKDLVKRHECTDSLMDLASCYYKTNFDETYKLCSRADQLNNGKEYTRALTKLGMAGSRYRKNELEPALKLYQESLAAVSTRDKAIVPRMSLAGLGATYCRLKQYPDSAKAYEELYKLNRDLYGSEDVECGWSLLQASYALAKTEDKPKSEACFRRAIYVFRKNNVDRIEKEFKDAGTPLTDAQHNNLQKALYGEAGSAPPPDPIDESKSKYSAIVSETGDTILSPWKRQFKQVEAPGWVWFDPRQPIDAILFCIHGLGLHHKTYEALAKRMMPYRVMTLAMDVRGFGTYLETSGMEKLSMQDCVDDLRGIIRMLRKDYPSVPLFVLGESMGGALALRLVAEEPTSVDGLICSVPSGNRYKSASTKLKVGASFLHDKRKPIPVGLKVVQQATQDPELRRQWIDDPSSRLTLSPEELLNFQHFMDENPKVASLIDKTPVILFQGHNDKLVKESGSIDLFDALRTPRKTMVLLGDTEHLIFEAGQFKEEMPLLLSAWIKAQKLAANKMGSFLLP